MPGRGASIGCSRYASLITTRVKPKIRRAGVASYITRILVLLIEAAYATVSAGQRLFNCFHDIEVAFLT
ncbi:hypothetical protein ALO43_101250 [Pseudomonas tremae]|uniref:Uncharacterized protein n=1 Tax=Pseudomonas tremae TaxID=200454 RepID=A0AA40P3A1_9PSED|nr:hypothetical protein ALO77_101272 [Pseudomonas coronafaciens pv. garcae]KPY97491.1 hypothetical protein ALO43_101250 [Pseudomonas tremae]RMN86961.1 hypothetical protein ALQ50_101241 [Pseudomonas coronafaciens pv. coronafaciens]RMO05384.1 hypothetical protein ALQ48_100241 [Pseudomonas coronafaciens pv. zizaniae]RMS97047.1 hypothetical protein ALP57_101457 [Pseudomonas coronafaciens pv. oryzae]RMU87331.1 hypothetical protein ALP22_101719 [Pseudomonas coronafaciens pv. porri]